MNIPLTFQRSLSSVSLLRGSNRAGRFSLSLITRNGKACLNPIGSMKNGMNWLKKMWADSWQWLKAENQLRKPFPTSTLELKTAGSLSYGEMMKVWIGFIFTTILRTLDHLNGKLKPRKGNQKKIVTRG